MGRPTKLTPEVQEALCLELSTGAPIDLASQHIGLHRDTVRDWLQRGEAQPASKYGAFRVAVEKARASVVQKLLRRAHERVQSKADGGIDADPLPLLAVVDKRFSPQVRVQVASELTGALDRLEAEFRNEPEILERCLRAIAEEGGPGEVAAAPRGPLHEDAGSGEAVRPAPAEPSAAPVSGA